MRSPLRGTSVLRAALTLTIALTLGALGPAAFAAPTTTTTTASPTPTTSATPTTTAPTTTTSTSTAPSATASSTTAPTTTSPTTTLSPPAPNSAGATSTSGPTTSTPTTSTPATSTPATAAPTTTPAPQVNHNPEGFLNSWSAGDGTIYFSGYAFDRDSFDSKLTTFYTLDNRIVAFQIASNRSSELDRYGLPFSGVFGGIQAPSAGAHQLCMFAGNVGPGSDSLVSCVNVTVAPKDPRGDISVAVQGGQVTVIGWLFDESNMPQSLNYWVVDNQTLVAASNANLPSPYLYAYGVPGSHAFAAGYRPTTSGSHQVCVYGINVGFGQSAWIKCVTVTVDATADNPKGELVLDAYDYEGNGLTDLFAYAYAYDPNDPTASIDVSLIVDGQAYERGTANMDSSDWNPNGVSGPHAYYTFLGEVGFEFAPGNHQVCLLAHNIGPGSDVLLQCENVTL